MSFDPLIILSERFKQAIAAAFPDQPASRDADPLITPGRNPQLADFQSNAAMPLGKALGKPPREIASAILAKLDLTAIAEPFTDASIAGPGFINIRLSAAALAGLLGRLDTPSLGIDLPEHPHRIVVDLCGVNLAKQMHVGHLRSIIIGDALARTLTRLGHTVVRQNHVGDWGLNIAMVTAKAQAEHAAGRLSFSDLSLDDLERLYKLAQRECSADERGLAAALRWWAHPKAVAELETQVTGAREELAKAKATLVRLQAHDPETVAAWQRIADITMRACLETCARLHADVRAEHSAGESSYSEELALVVDDLARRAVAEESNGALVVRCEGIDEPCLIRKSDGGFLYATTDMAAIRRRVQKLGASRVIYCVDIRQGLHFKQIFCAAHKAGYAATPTGPALLEHAGFGMVLGEDGRPYKTRTGENIKLTDLIDEAIERAGAVVAAKSPDLPPAERARIAEVVAIAAIKYADLSNDRARDYVFSFDRMLAFEGNTGPYLLYALARTRSILRKAAEQPGGPPAPTQGAGAPLRLTEKHEKELALALLRYPGALRSVAQSLEPHRLCQYLYDLAGAFSAFYTNCPVLTAQGDATRASRLRLCALTERLLADGLNLLGIETVDRM
ncbi:MAG: arginine--tRNA ligase [Phycisphaerales bacterium]|nr:arginine--tRNA ligase [Phycisphaerales bacterium]